MSWDFGVVLTSGEAYHAIVSVVSLLALNPMLISTPVNAEEPLPDDFVPATLEEGINADGEKVDFPSGRGALPTFSVAFANDTPPSQMKFGTPRLGPRFTSPSVEPFETPTEGRSVQSSFSAQSGSYGGALRGPTIRSETIPHFRSGSISSQNSYSTYKSTGSSTSTSSLNKPRADRLQANPFSKKWAIE